MSNLDSFFSLVDIKEEEKDSAKEFIKLRGLEEHILMANYLASHLENKKPTYSEVATAFRYDKRIRRIVYNYIGLIEEYYRSFLCNNFSKPIELGIKTNKSLYDYCCDSLFSKIVEMVWSLDDSYKSQLFESAAVLKKNVEALVKLRNVISHNRTLINFRDFKEVNLSRFEKGHSPFLNIKNLFHLLPNSIKNSFREEINSASRVGVRKRTSQVEWNLDSFLIIRI